MSSNEDFSFQSIADKEKEQKEQAKENPLLTMEQVVQAFQTARFTQLRIQEREKVKKLLEEDYHQMRVLNLQLMDFFRGRDLEQQGNSGWENRVTAFFYEMYLKMQPPNGPVVSRQELIEETHRWKEAERKSDERAKKAESELDALKRKLMVPTKVLESANMLDNSPIKEHLGIPLVDALNDVTDFIRDRAMGSSGEKKS